MMTAFIAFLEGDGRADAPATLLLMITNDFDDASNGSFELLRSLQKPGVNAKAGRPQTRLSTPNRLLLFIRLNTLCMRQNIWPHVASTATMVGGATINALRQTGIRQADDLVAYAAAHPALADMLMMKAPSPAGKGSMSFLVPKSSALMMGSAAALGRNNPRAPDAPKKDRYSNVDFPRVSAERLNGAPTIAST